MSRLYLFDDARAREWSPFRLTRPAGELLFGCLLLRERIERWWDAGCDGHLAGQELLGFEEPDAPPAVTPDRIGDDEPRVLLSSRLVPDLGAPPPRPDGPATLVVDDEVVGWVLPSGTPTPGDAGLAEPSREPAPGRTIELSGTLLRHPWDLVTGNPARIRSDIPDLFPHSHAFLPPEVDRVGDEHPVSVGRDVELEPGVVLDTREGPIRLSDGVRILAHTRIAGPSYVGPGTTVLGGKLTAVSLGPVCKIHGEVEESVILGYTNKAHHGYLGHAYLGRWVNLGAMTTNSDLKNNYGSIRVRTRGSEVDTGLLKLGCFFGDHAKTGIGMLLNTGTVVGAGSNLFGSAMPPKYVPPFSWGHGRELGEYRLDAFLDTAKTVMGRRDQELPEGVRALLRRAWEATRDEREVE